MRNEIYDYEKRLERYKRIIKGLRNGGLALKFLDHLSALGLSIARVSKYASHLPTLLRVIDFDLASATKRDVERVVAWINRQPYREWTKHDEKLTLRKLIQYAEYERHESPKKSAGSALESRRDSKITPDNLLFRKDFGAIAKVVENLRIEHLCTSFFEAVR